MKKTGWIFTAIAGLVLLSNSVSAHVVVRPNQAGIGAFQTFNMSVPSEKDLSTTGLRLILPNGLEFVTPSVKPGWKVEVKKHQLPGGEHPYEIVWSEGNIPGHFRDDFTFGTKVPATPGVLRWKAYQTYSDGAVVSWDLDPKAEQPKKTDGTPDFSKIGPYSETSIVDDLSGTSNSSGSVNFALSVTAILIAFASLVVSFRRR